MGKNRAAKPTRAQKILMDRHGLAVKNWLVLADTPEELRLVSRGTGRNRTIRKGEK